MRDHNTLHSRFPHLLRHLAMVPKGFLKYKMLQMLSEKSMSGSEIMQELEEESGGRWRPSPGSVYPMISWLREKKYIKETHTEEMGIKQYVITDEGKNFLHELRKRKEEIEGKMCFFTPMFLPPWASTHRRLWMDLKEASRSLIDAMHSVGRQMQRQYSKETVSEVKKVLEEAAEKIEKIAEKTKEKG